MSRFLCLLLLAGCSYWSPDNPIEEAVEAGIEQATGVDIDLSADDEKLQDIFMSFLVQNFSEASPQLLTNAINAWFTANPGATGISISFIQDSATYSALLLYSI